MKFKFYSVIFASVAFTISSLAFASVSKTETKVDTKVEIENSLFKILGNFDHPMITRGAIIASPSQTEPNYFYHWTRDAGLVVLTLMTQAEQYPNVMPFIDQWGRFERYAQSQANLGGGTGLGEPKYNVDGSAFTGPWGRPQNDGPAIRSLAYLRAFHKIDRFVEADLDYLVKNWEQPDVDLWEEVRGNHFFTRYAQMTALRYAAVHYEAGLSTRNAKALYHEANKIEKTLNSFIDTNAHVVTPTLPGSQGVAKHQGIDISVLLAMNYFGPTKQLRSDDEPTWSFSKPNMLYTAYRISDTFQNLYSINQKFAFMAPGIGRYPEDVYDGNGFTGGNPWFLATFGMAEYYCSLVQELIEKGSLSTDPLSAMFYAQMNSGRQFKQSGSINKTQAEFWSTLRAIQAKADSSIQRAFFHAGQNGHYSEQFDRDSGYQRGASDLTWSYASKVRALGRCQASGSQLQK